MRWRKALKGMSPYTPGRSIEEVKELYGLEEVVKLASNENPYGTVPSVKAYLATERSILKYIQMAMRETS